MNTVLSLAEYIRYFICEPKVRETFGDMFQYYSIILCAVSCTPSRITGTGDTERIQMREEMNTCRKKMRKRNQVNVPQQVGSLLVGGTAAELPVPDEPPCRVAPAQSFS